MSRSRVSKCRKSVRRLTPEASAISSIVTSSPRKPTSRRVAVSRCSDAARRLAPASEESASTTTDQS